MDDAGRLYGRLHEWRLHRIVLAGHISMLGQWRGVVLSARNVGTARRLYGTDMRGRRLLRRMRLEPDPMPRERRRDMRHDRPMGNTDAMHRPDVPHGLLHRRLRAKPNAMQRQHAANLQCEWHMDERSNMHEPDVRERSMCRRVLPGADAMPRQLDSIVQRDGHVADADHLLRSYSRLSGEQLRRVQPRTDAMLG